MAEIEKEKQLLTKREKFLIYALIGVIIILVLLGIGFFQPELSNAWLVAIIIFMSFIIFYLFVKKKEPIIDYALLIQKARDREYEEFKQVLDDSQHNAQVDQIGKNEYAVHFIKEGITYKMTPITIYGKLIKDMTRVKRDIENSKIATSLVQQKQLEIEKLENLDKAGYDVGEKLKEIKGEHENT